MEIGIQSSICCTDPDGSEMYDSGFAPFEGLDYQQYIYFGDFETCDLLANNTTGSDCDDTDASLNNNDSDGDGQTSCEGDCDDFDPTRNSLDVDGDGISSCDGDCNDENPNIFYDTDFDQDGFTTCVDDCDDNNMFLIHLESSSYKMELIRIVLEVMQRN